uniref:Gypsy retrotransposon integrase-like protein 1 n=2 Tax=Oryzias sinensis TaxID=183150 RepID=A0A8C7WMF3_9TELE
MSQFCHFRCSKKSSETVAHKKTDKVRICVDLTHLNLSVCREKYILPSVEETLGKLAGARIFSKLDANMGFWQIPLTEESAKYTTFITPFGRYYFRRLPFGIASAPEHFQNRMSEVTNSLEGVVCHMDDVLVWGRTQEEHDTRLHVVLKRLQEAGISLNVEKCELSKQEVIFLGHVISANGISPDPSKTEAVKKMREPTNVSELRSFLGTVNQLGKFIPQLAERDKPLRDLLSKKIHWVWGIDQAQAFQDLKDSLASPPVLAMYDPNRDSKVSADASSYGLGSVLLQKWGSDWRPVAYISRSLTPTEQRYAQIEKEALALIWACERFRNFLIGKHFQMETDHKPLLSLLGSQQLDALPPRIQRFKMRLMRYSYSISHVPGKSLWTADMLSRAPLLNNETPDDKELLEDTNIYVDRIMENLPASTFYLDHLKQELQQDSVCARVMQLCEQGWPTHYNGEPAIRPYWAERASLSVQDGLLLKGDRLVIPSSLRNGVLTTLHESHQGVLKCRERARQSVWWPGLSQQINELVLYCRICSKERYNPAEPLLPTQYPGRPWQKLGADLFMLGAKTYLLVVDYTSRFVEIALLSTTKSANVIHHLKSIFARHGIPEQLVTDNGPQFSGAVFAEFAQSYGFHHITSSPKHPQSNGEAERAVKTVKELLKKAADPYLALLAYRATPLQNGYSPAQLLMERRLRTTVPTLPALLQPALPDMEAVSH